MGNREQALHLITDKLRNVDQAIDFCKEHNDSELWEDLIEHSIDKPSKLHRKYHVLTRKAPVTTIIVCFIFCRLL